MTLSFADLFTPEAVVLDLEATTKPEALHEMVVAAIRAGVLPRRRQQEVLDAMLEREERGSTGLGGGVAIPHAKIEGLRKHSGLVARASAGLDFRAVDGEPVYVLVMLISPLSRAEEHLMSLRWLSGIARDPDFASFIRQARTPADVLEVLTERA